MSVCQVYRECVYTFIFASICIIGLYLQIAMPKETVTSAVPSINSPPYEIKMYYILKRTVLLKIDCQNIYLFSMNHTFSFF